MCRCARNTENTDEAHEVRMSSVFLISGSLRNLSGNLFLWVNTLTLVEYSELSVASLLFLVAADLRAVTERCNRSGIVPDLFIGYFNNYGRSEIGRYLMSTSGFARDTLFQRIPVDDHVFRGPAGGD